MSTDLKAISKIPQHQRSLISGYLREYEAFFFKEHDDNPYYNISELAVLLTLSFYAILEYIDIYRDDMIELSNDNQTITKLSGLVWGNASFGIQHIDPINDNLNYKWSIQIEKMCSIAEIGFTSCDNVDSGIALYQLCPFYGLNCYAGIVEGKNNNNEKIVHELLAPAISIKTGDIIDLEFNADGNNSYIKFSVKGTAKACTIKAYAIELNIKYRMALSMEAKGDSLTIIDFQCMKA